MATTEMKTCDLKREGEDGCTDDRRGKRYPRRRRLPEMPRQPVQADGITRVIGHHKTAPVWFAGAHGCVI